MQRRTKFAVAGAAAVAALGIGTGVGIAATNGDDDQPLTGTDLERATTAALDHVGEGTVTETEVGDDGAAYGVEIRLDDGRQIEVNLDEQFRVIGSEDDDDGPDGVDDDDRGADKD